MCRVTSLCVPGNWANVLVFCFAPSSQKFCTKFKGVFQSWYHRPAHLTTCGIYRKKKWQLSPSIRGQRWHKICKMYGLLDTTKFQRLYKTTKTIRAMIENFWSNWIDWRYFVKHQTIHEDKMKSFEKICKIIRVHIVNSRHTSTPAPYSQRQSKFANEKVVIPRSFTICPVIPSFVTRFFVIFIVLLPLSLFSVWSGGNFLPVFTSFPVP